MLLKGSNTIVFDQILLVAPIRGGIALIY